MHTFQCPQSPVVPFLIIIWPIFRFGIDRNREVGDGSFVAVMQGGLGRFVTAYVAESGKIVAQGLLDDAAPRLCYAILVGVFVEVADGLGRFTFVVDQVNSILISSF